MNIFLDPVYFRLSFPAVRAEQFSGGRGGGSTQVRHKIQDGIVDLVAYRAYHRGTAGTNCPGNLFAVKDPKILPTAAAPGYQDNICSAAPVQAAQGLGNLVGGFFPLHIYRAEKEPA